jgi:hypothetical protein
VAMGKASTPAPTMDAQLHPWSIIGSQIRPPLPVPLPVLAWAAADAKSSAFFPSCAAGRTPWRRRAARWLPRCAAVRAGKPEQRTRGVLSHRSLLVLTDGDESKPMANRLRWYDAKYTILFIFKTNSSPIKNSFQSTYLFLVIGSFHFIIIRSGSMDIWTAVRIIRHRKICQNENQKNAKEGRQGNYSRHQ